MHLVLDEQFRYYDRCESFEKEASIEKRDINLFPYYRNIAKMILTEAMIQLKIQYLNDNKDSPILLPCGEGFSFCFDHLLTGTNFIITKRTPGKLYSVDLNSDLFCLYLLNDKLEVDKESIDLLKDLEKSFVDTLLNGYEYKIAYPVFKKSLTAFIWWNILSRDFAVLMTITRYNDQLDALKLFIEHFLLQVRRDENMYYHNFLTSLNEDNLKIVYGQVFKEIADRYSKLTKILPEIGHDNVYYIGRQLIHSSLDQRIENKDKLRKNFFDF